MENFEQLRQETQGLIDESMKLAEDLQQLARHDLRTVPIRLRMIEITEQIAANCQELDKRQKEGRRLEDGGQGGSALGRMKRSEGGYPSADY